MSACPPIDPLPWAMEGHPVPMPPPTPDESFAWCLAKARSHEENFPVVAGWLDETRRMDLAAIYAFAREADDFADEPLFEGMREALLDVWEQSLRRAWEGRPPPHPAFVALSVAIRRRGLPLEPFLDLLSAFRQDARGHRYRTFAEVLDYCRRSANPVGRLVLRVTEQETPSLLEASDALCTALQLTNFWQDLSVDLPRGRVYLPDEDFERLGLDREAVLKADRLPAELIEIQVRRTRTFFGRSGTLLRSPGTARVWLLAVRLGGEAVLGMVQALGPRIRTVRPSLAPRRWPSIVLSLLRTGG